MKISIITLAIITCAFFLLIGCLTFRKSDKALKKKCKKKHLHYSIKYDSFENKLYRYLEMNTFPEAPTIIFVHGAPGSATAFTAYFEDTTLTNHYNMVILDRPGYGYSDYGHYLSLEKQAEWIKSLVLKNFKQNPVFLIGHSFGGSIVARAAVLLDTAINGTIMIAPALDPENEKYFWFGKLGKWKSTRWLVSKALQISADEKYNHEASLKSIEPDWGNLKTPIMHIHGNKDKLVPFVNLAYSKHVFDSAVLEAAVWENDGHLIPFNKVSELTQSIYLFVQKHTK